MQTSNDRKWVVKSDNKILGPYSFEQLEDMIKKKQISILDEVRDMKTRWLYIRECKDLSGVVSEIRKSIEQSADHTKTIQTRHSYTGTLSKTHEIAEIENQSLPTFTNVNVNSSEIQDIDFKEENIAPVTKTNHPIPQSSSYVQYHDPAVQKELKQSHTVKLVIVSVLAILAIGGVMGYQYYKQKTAEKIETAALTEVKKYYSFGMEKKFLESFATLVNQQQRKLLPDVINLWPKLEQVGLINLKEEVQKIKSINSLSLQQKSELELVDFNRYMYQHDYKKARESIIKARDFDPANEINKENDAILSCFEGAYKNSAELFKQLFKLNPKGRYLFLYLANLWLSNNDETNSAVEEIKQYTENHFDYQKELDYLGMIYSLKQKKSQDFDFFYSKFVEFPIRFREQFFIPFSVYSTIYNGYMLNQIFEQSKNVIPADKLSLVQMHIKLENFEGILAEKMMNDNQFTIANNSLKAITRLLIDQSLKNYENVIAAEKTILSDEMNMSAHYALMESKRALDRPDNDLLNHVSYFIKKGSFWSNWAKLYSESSPSKRFLSLPANQNDYLDLKIVMEAKGSKHD